MKSYNNLATIGKWVPTSRNGKNKCELTDPPIVLSSKEDRKDTGYLNENPETHQIDNRLKQFTNYTEIENSNEFHQFATGGNAQFSNCDHTSKGPHVVKLRENLEILAFHGCDFNIPVNTRVPAGIKVCEPLNHTDVGILTACSVIEIPENSTKENRNIVVRILNTSSIPQTIYQNTPILNLVDVTRLKECSTADALCGADGTDYVSGKFSEIHTSCYEGHIVENMVFHLKGGDKKFLQRMKISHKNALNNIERNTQRYHDNFNKKAIPHKFKLGDKVYLYEPADKVGITTEETSNQLANVPLKYRIKENYFPLDCESESEEEIVTDESEENVDRTDRMSSVLENGNTESNRNIAETDPLNRSSNISRDGVDDDNQIIDSHGNDSMRSLDADREINDDVAQVSINIRNPEPLEQQIRPQRIRQLPKRTARPEIIAYDCADRATELTKVSLLAVKPCQDPRNFSESNFRRIQLVQKRQYVPIHILTYQVTVQQLIDHCGMHSHRSTVAGGFGKYIQHIEPEQCLKAHRFRQLDLKGMGAGVISKLNLNGTTEVSATLLGFADANGRCEGVRFAVDYVAIADVERNLVTLRSGGVCPYNDGYCFDNAEGEVTWQQHLSSLCSTSGVDVLYEGNATLLVLSRNPPNRYVVVETTDTVFALKLTKPEEICAQKAWLTEQNRLLLIFEDSVGFYYHRTIRIPQNTDMLAQVLSKLLYLEIEVKRQMADVIYDSIMKRCHLREKLLQNRLAMAKQSPDAVGNLVKETSGYVSRVMGEVLYIAKCRAVVVDYRKTSYCYQELPVTYLNRSLYRTAITHILVEHGTKRTTDASELDANDEEDKLSMPSISISPISSNGIYSKEDMESFQQTLLYPNTRKAVTNQVARRIIALDSSDPYYMPNLFSKTEFTNLAHAAAEEVWGFLSKMGNLFSICGFLYTIACALASQRRDRDEEDQKNELNPVSVDATAPQEQSSSSFYPILPKSTAPCSDPNCKLNNEKNNPRDP
ncbi:unnamed protein product [Ceutorhynchus assimilis]|uniref:Uncharacterized protein n=1 Tax=Ceutorhynchus assimilis TaxID=467358 RepID=A0A9N9MFK7_9CUCU|nr:unnamed protein product [Ceutorhynchus assimilis]